MLSFFQWNKPTFSRLPKLDTWIKEWSGIETETLIPKDWFGKGHDHDRGEVNKEGYWTNNIRFGPLFRILLWLLQRLC